MQSFIQLKNDEYLTTFLTESIVAIQFDCGETPQIIIELSNGTDFTLEGFSKDSYSKIRKAWMERSETLVTFDTYNQNY
jgi:hypothetical protein